MKKSLEEMCHYTYYLKHEREIQLIINKYLNKHLKGDRICVCEHQKTDLLVKDHADEKGENGVRIELKYQFWYDRAKPKTKHHFNGVGEAIRKDLCDRKADIFILVIYNDDMEESQDGSHWIGKAERHKPKELKKQIVARWRKDFSELEGAKILHQGIRTPTLFSKSTAINFRFMFFVAALHS